MVRNEKGPVGAANVPEFGSVTTEEGFRGLITMSAYHHVRPGTAYPAVLIMTGLNDARVPPWHSAKMAAALQAATSSDRPVLLRVDTAAGHESGAVAQEQRLLRSADVFGFAMAQVGLLP
jgi:prolyl oligopeptidase